MRALLIAAAMLVAGALAPAMAAEPLVEVPWLKANLGADGLVVLDLRSAAEYQQGHIPGSVNSDYAKAGWRVDRESDKVPEVLPPDLTPLARHLGELGIDSTRHVVLVPSGKSASDVGAGTRVYWTLKLMGHDNVSLLNGGFAQWSKDKANPVDTAKVEPQPRTFTIAMRPHLLASEEDVAKAMEAGTPLVDSRSEDFYVGINKSGKAKAAGTIPGARNLPFTWLVDGAVFRTKAQIEFLSDHAQVAKSGAQIQFCNTGHLGSIGWFAASEILGNAQARLYDGSMTEWTIHGRPVEQRVKLP